VKEGQIRGLMNEQKREIDIQRTELVWLG